MRLLLDAHVSGRVIATELRRGGHDVVVLSEHLEMEGATDRQVLELAASEGRLLVTFDVKDFAPLVREWAEAGRHHAGVILVHGLDHRDFGPLLRGLERLFEARPGADDWTDLAVFLTGASGEGR